MDFVRFRNLSMLAVVLAGVAVFFLFPGWYVPLLPGLTLLWGEFAVGIAANRVAHRLTREAVAMKGIDVEQNPIVKDMMRTGKSGLLLRIYAAMVLLCLFLTVLSLVQGAVWFGVLVLVLSFPLTLAYDMLNDYVWLRRFKHGPASG